MRLIVPILAIVLLSACQTAPSENLENRKESYQGLSSSVSFIGHKGAGDPPEYGYRDFPANSYESVRYGIQHTEGSEVDIQMSADSALWLFHDHELKKCDGTLENIALLTNREIQKISECNYGNHLIKFDRFIEKIKGLSADDKILSLDLKVLQNPMAISTFGGKKNLAASVIRQINELGDLENFEILVEVPDLEYLEIFENDTPFEIYLLARNRADLQTTLPQGYSADIRLFDNGEIQYDTSKSLQVWVVNSMESMIKLRDINADYVQTDNIPLVDFLYESAGKPLERHTLSAHDTLSGTPDQEYIDLTEIQIEDDRKNFVLKFTYGPGSHLNSPTTLVFSCRKATGQHVYWKGMKLSADKHEYFEFINIDKLRRDGGETLKVFIWNREKGTFNLNEARLIAHSLQS